MRLTQFLHERLVARPLQKKLDTLLKHAGFEKTSADIFPWLLQITGIVSVPLTAYLGIQAWHADYQPLNLAIIIVSLFALIAVVTFLVLLAGLLVWLRLRIYQRRLLVEEVFPEFLQLAAMNVRAGMTIDKALWQSIKPRFGILAKEMEVVAKRSMAGEELRTAFNDFADKYDSALLRRSVNLIVEGMDAGGEVAKLLTEVAQNITDTQAMKKEMAANVANYVIFITFATLVAAPLLFALSSQLLHIVSSLGQSLDLTGVQGAVPFSFSAEGIAMKDFTSFAVISLSITGFFSAMIVATISKGNVKAGIKYIPLYVLVAIVLFFIFQKVLRAFFQGFF